MLQSLYTKANVVFLSAFLVEEFLKANNGIKNKVRQS